MHKASWAKHTICHEWERELNNYNKHLWASRACLESEMMALISHVASLCTRLDPSDIHTAWTLHAVSQKGSGHQQC